MADKKKRKKADRLATSQGSIANKVKARRQRNKKALDDVMGSMGHNRSGKYGN